eukprot:scaffold86087_cov19-Prasinocladus_malaysianus.AAC.1
MGTAFTNAKLSKPNSLTCALCHNVRLHHATLDSTIKRIEIWNAIKSWAKQIEIKFVMAIQCVKKHEE